jgi:hypothetical protein
VRTPLPPGRARLAALVPPVCECDARLVLGHEHEPVCGVRANPAPRAHTPAIAHPTRRLLAPLGRYRFFDAWLRDAGERCEACELADESLEQRCEALQAHDASRAIQERMHSVRMARLREEQRRATAPARPVVTIRRFGDGHVGTVVDAASIVVIAAVGGAGVGYDC